MKKFTIALLALTITSCETTDLSNTLSTINTAILGQPQSALTQQDIAAGLKQALEIGSSRALSATARTNGFWEDKLIKIALPPEYQRLQSTLSAIGMGNIMDDVHLKLNRAAEAASDKAKPIFLNAITGLTIEDAIGILKGGDTAATTLLQQKTHGQLVAAFLPVVQNALGQVGAVREIEALRAQIQAIPFASYLAPQLDTDISNYVVTQTLNGTFAKLALEEKAIRKNPAKRTTELLQRVFAR